MIRIPLTCLFSWVISTSALMAQALEASFPVFDGSIRVPVGNHGSTAVEILNQTQLKTSDGYGPHSEEITLDLTTGVIELTTIDYTPLKTTQSTSFLPADQGGDYLPYRRQLQAMIGDLTWVNQNLFHLGEVEQTTRQPQVNAVLQYVNAFLAAADAKAPDSVALNPLPRDLRRDIGYSISVESMTQVDRDLLLDVLDAQGGRLERTQVRIPAGHRTVDVALKIPALAPLDQPGFIAAKLVPVGACASDLEIPALVPLDQPDFNAAKLLPVDDCGSDFLAEVKQPVRFKKTQMITSASASYINFNSPRVSFYINHYCAASCDIRVDIFDAQGQWLAEQVVSAKAPYTKNAEQFTNLSLQTPVSLLPAGQTFTYYAKILPPGGSWDQYVDEVRGTFQTSN